MGITYRENCLIGANNFIDKLLCGNSWQQTQSNKFMLIIVILALGILFFIYRFTARKNKK